MMVQHQFNQVEFLFRNITSWHPKSRLDACSAIITNLLPMAMPHHWQEQRIVISSLLALPDTLPSGTHMVLHSQLYFCGHILSESTSLFSVDSVLSESTPNSSLLSLVKAFDSVLEVYDGFCNLKQLDLKLKICGGSSVRKILVREAKAYFASKVIVGTSSNHHGIRPFSTSVAKYCARKLPADCCVLALNNAKLVFQRESTLTSISGSTGDEGEGCRSNFRGLIHRTLSKKSTKLLTNLHFNQQGHPRDFLKSNLTKSKTLPKQSCSVCATESESLQWCSIQSAGETLNDEAVDNSLALIPVQTLEGNSIGLLVGSLESLKCLLSTTNSNTDTSVEDDGISMLFTDCENLWSFNSSGAISSGESENNGLKEGGNGSDTYQCIHNHEETVSQCSSKPTSSKRSKEQEEIKAGVNYPCLDIFISDSSTTEGGFKPISEKPKKPRLDKHQSTSNINFQQANPWESSEPDTEAIAQMKEMIYRAESLDQGKCLSALKCDGFANWGCRRRITFIVRHSERKSERIQLI